MQSAEARALSALRAAGRRYRMRPLPPDLPAAAREGDDAVLALAMEALRTGQATREVRAAFLHALARLVRRALQAEPAFQAQVLRASEAQVDEYARLASAAAADRRTVRSAVDAVAHPGKLRGMEPGAMRDALQRVHALTCGEKWEALSQALAADERLLALRGSDALCRLLRLEALLRSDSVQRYLALNARTGPLAGSGDAVAQGRSAARAGDAAEAATVQAFRRLAAPRDRVVRGLRTPAGFPAPRAGAKDEFDVVLVRDGGIVLLAEAKASPAAASTDWPRLLRGLQRLAQADAQGVYDFGSAEGPVQLHGAALRALVPRGDVLPEPVIYCSTAPVEERTPWLGAAARAMLLAEPGSVEYALSGEVKGLEAVWDALQQPRLRPVLHQYETARVVREAMVHPDDLLAAVAGVGVR